MFQLSRFTYLTLAIGGVMCLLLLANSRGLFKRDLASPVQSQSAAISFRQVSIFDGKRQDGTRFANYVYKSADCVALSHVTTFLATADGANDEVDRETEMAAAVIERGAKLDNQGERVGERRVLEFRDDEHNHSRAEIAWNEHANLHLIVAPSLSHALAFEKSLQSPAKDRILNVAGFRSVTFTISKTSEGKTETGLPYSEKQFQTSDCEAVTTRTMHFDAPALANEQFNKQLKEATNIVEQGAKLNAAGQPVGERAVAMLKAEGVDDPLDKTLLAWTDGSDYQSVTGPYEQVLAFEKRNHQK